MTKRKNSDLLNDTGWSGTNYTKCHDSHKELPMGKGVILGASCNYPRPGYDIYIGFDYGMRLPAPPLPWEPAPVDTAQQAIHAKFEIQDMGVPKDFEAFSRMILWVCDQLHAGKRIHIGCIGGHGRTGLVLAAIRCVMEDDQNAGQWVRDNHCKKAIESQVQVEFLQKHYGITPVKASKGWSAGSFDNKYGGGMGMSGKSSNGKALKKDYSLLASKGTTGNDGAVGNDLTDGTLITCMRTPLTLF